MKELLSGNEAVARGAFEADVKLASAYPGTPSTEILETIADRFPSIYSKLLKDSTVFLFHTNSEFKKIIV